MKSRLRHLTNGIIIGSSMLLPGVSGGSMAIILGVYDRLIIAVSQLKKDFRKNFLFLFVYACGGLLGILLFSKALLYITNTYESPMMFLFLGAVCGSIPLLWKKAQLHRNGFKRINMAYAGMGFMLVVIIDLLPEGMFAFTGPLSASDYLVLFLLGILLAIALVLPGISFSYMLLVLGLYQPALTAVSNMEISFLAVLGIGVIAGILLTTKLLAYTMERFPSETFLIIIGFVLSTLREIYPGIPKGISLPICFFTFLAGFLAISFISSYSND